jgi:peptidoglycan/xylan/chitin deacetylase (PgdA/CDA1 family)
VLVIGLLALVALVGGLLGRPDASAKVPLRLVWAFSPASNTVTVWVAHPAGTSGRQVLARSRLAVSEDGGGQPGGWSAGDGSVRVPVPPGRRTSLLIRLTGPQPLTQAVTVTAPPPLSLVASRGASGRWLVDMSSPLRSPSAQVLCGTDQVSLAAPAQVAVSDGGTACQAQLQLTAQDGEQAVVPVTVPALPPADRPAVDRLYCFASPAGGAVYITIDDGWTPSAQVLDIMRQTHVPVTAFLIQKAAQENLGYWQAFVAAGGVVADHTVSHPYLTKLSLRKATAQWAGAQAALGRWFGQTPDLGRPPYGAFNHKVEVAAARGGLLALAGWSATMSGDTIQTWDGKPLRAGEIVILHWVPGLDGQFAALLAQISALNLHPAPLTWASFTGIAPQQHSLSGD